MSRSVAISGAGGLVGSALVTSLRDRGDRVLRLVRRDARGDDELAWDPSGETDAAGFEGVDAVVHLAGESIAALRWTAAKKRAIRTSRVVGTRSLATAIAQCGAPPRVFVSASAVGYYGSCGDRVLTEGAPAGDDFLAEVCVGWEGAADVARDAGVRVVHPRIGLVLASHSGALERMLPPFRAGVGGRLGSGRQWMSWITLHDLVRLLVFAIDSDVRGPMNATAPNPVTNADFTTALGRAVGRPTVLPAPKFALKAALGEMADALLLASQRTRPEVALGAGFTYDYPEIDQALAAVLGVGRTTRGR